MSVLVGRVSHYLFKGKRLKPSFNYCHTKHYEREVKIGNVSKCILDSKNPQLIPTGYLSKNMTQSSISYLQWIMKKDILGQDIFLIGLPGPLRSSIMLQYLELTEREVEYLVLSRDTTENDIKQRREIRDGTAHYVDQSAVRAAIEGRFLLLDGIEKVERNVLPVLNNLLENREMQLEDGRFLVEPEKYDKLLQMHSKEVLDEWKLVRVSENFRVAALGLPVPVFKGNPLDPPFRSRFQACYIQPNFEEQLHEFSTTSNIDIKALKNLLSSCYAILSTESSSLGIPKFPIGNINSSINILKSLPNVSVECLFRWMYPYNLILSKEGQKLILETLRVFSVYPQRINTDFVVNESMSENDYLTHSVEFNSEGEKNVCHVWGHKNNFFSKTDINFVPNLYHNNIIADMLKTHIAHDFCVVGNKGSGKSVVVKKFASLLNYPIEMVMLYADMTARDLLQQRITDENGNTLWRSSQLVEAAADGKLLVLDGLHRLHSSTLSVLQRLIHHREMQLYDGTRLLRHDRYDVIKQKYGFTDVDMKSKNMLRIHPSFRIVALAEPPKLQSSKSQWMTPEVLSMFLFHTVRPLSLEEERLIIKHAAGNINQKVEDVLKFAHILRSSSDESLQNVGATFSTRQLIRLARRLITFPDEDIYTLVTQACLFKFLPQLTKQAIESVLYNCNIKSNNSSDKMKEIKVKNDKLYIGNTSSPIYKPGHHKVKVPEILFYNNNEHLIVMEAMLQDFLLGEHLLLVGNQGVGKNKITDRFLQLLNRPREYIQLHRDTSVQSLTQQPTVKDGKIVYEDSPLLKAVQHGHVLVVDEADKAPTHVTSILKALVESGEMILSDGRRIIHHADTELKKKLDVVVMHPDFRMIVLANRPGFPFLGNDFFATLGDIFSCHAVDNPTLESEVQMLHQYGPNVAQNLVLKLAKLFRELRAMSDAGLISYPYSTREVVNIIKHLNKFPDESVARVLKNVFDFDFCNTDFKELLKHMFRKYGIPLLDDALKIKMGKVYPLPEPSLKSAWEFERTEEYRCSQHKLHLSDGDKLSIKEKKLDLIDARANIFSEQINYCQIPLKNNDVPLDITTTGDLVYVVSANPVSLFTVNQDKALCNILKMSNYFPSLKSGFRPEVRISALSGEFEGCIVLHESTTNKCFLIQPSNRLVRSIDASFLESDTFKLSDVYSKSVKYTYSFTDFPSRKKILLYKRSGSKIMLIDFASYQTYHLSLPFNIKNISSVNESAVFILGEEEKFIADVTNLLSWKVRKINSKSYAQQHSDYKIIKTINSLHAMDFIKVEAEKALLMNLEDFACVSSGSLFSDNYLNIYGFPREKPVSVADSYCISESSQIIRFLQPSEVLVDVDDEDVINNDSSGYLEVTDLVDLTSSYMLIKLSSIPSSYAAWLAGTAKNHLLMSLSPKDDLITVDMRGCIQKWETNKASLQKSFQEWQKLVGFNNKKQLTIEHKSNNPVTAPKHGKIDPTGAPHVGGNTWAGGTGGRDTAGLGGKGGPYRLDSGHTVYQLSDYEKESVPLEVRMAARQMAKKAYQDKLREIEMSEYDGEIYEQFYGNVKKQINKLRIMLDGLQAKDKERLWMKHQTSGELDDAKLIEGITGEKLIYKKRGDQEPEMGSPQEKPKLLKLIVDVSGSMYRFNGHDNRLQRELECVVLVMEAFEGYQEKFQYEIIGHSGEEFCVELCSFKKPPKNNKERLNVLKKMYAHSQFCMSGDNTLPATEHAIKTITKEDADEYFVIVMSDANFDRYGISPTAFGDLLVSDSKVNAFAIFIGSLGDQANALSKELPAGRGFVCFDSANLTQILQKIFTSALLKD